MRRNLKAARLYAGMTQSELAVKVRRTQGWVCQIELGNYPPKANEAEKLSQVLNLPEKYLLPNVTLKREKKS